jgi:hypothetical protein
MLDTSREDRAFITLHESFQFAYDRTQDPVGSGSVVDRVDPRAEGGDDQVGYCEVQEVVVEG